MAKTQLDRIEADIHLVKEWVFGNGRDGAKVRIDRLERKWVTVAWAVGIVAAVVVAVSAKVMAGWIGTP